MQLHFTGRNFEVTPSLKQFTTEKFDRLTNHFKRITDVYLVFHVEKDDQIAEATLKMMGKEIHATAKSGDMYDTVDTLIDKLHVQIVKVKDKLTDHRE